MVTVSKKKKIVIGILILFIIVLLIYLTIRYLQGLTYDPEKPYQTIKEAVEALGHTYLKEETSTEEGFSKDIYLNFSVDLYTEENSNEKIYNDLIYTIARVEKYKSFRLIDPEKETVIAVLANEQEKKLVRIYINGDDNYFGRHRSMATIEEYKETPTTEFIVQSQIIQELIRTNWSTNVNLGNEEEKREDYRIYLDEGLEVKKVDNNVFNIVFTENHANTLVNGIKVGETIDTVISILGTPTFGNKNEGLVGYKGEQFYIFFMEKEISVYPVLKNYETEEFMQLVTTYTEEGNASNFVNEVTGLWSDYDLYEHDTNYVKLRYTLKGIEIQFNITPNHGITYYQNYQGEIKEGINFSNLKEKEEELSSYTYFQLDTDLVYKTEQERFNAFLLREKEKETLNPYDE